MSDGLFAPDAVGGLAQQGESKPRRKRVYTPEQAKRRLEKHREWRAKNRDRINLKRREWAKTHKPQRAAASKRYKERHREAIRERQRAYRAAHIDELRDKQREYVEKNKDKIRERHRKYQEENRDEINARRMAKYNADPEKYRAQLRESNRKHRDKRRDKELQRLYGITLEKFKATLLLQHNSCAICKQSFAGKRKPHIDHDHKTGLFRSLLCTYCNIAVGMVQEDLQIIYSLAEYLKHHGAKDVRSSAA